MDMTLIVFLVMTSCIVIQTLKVGATFSCKILANSFQITLRDIPHDLNYKVSLCQLTFSFVSRYILW